MFLGGVYLLGNYLIVMLYCIQFYYMLNIGFQCIQQNPSMILIPIL